MINKRIVNVVSLQAEMLGDREKYRVGAGPGNEG